MNKLIIIGNGFDIHNGLATRYSDFIKWYVQQCFDKCLEGSVEFNELVDINKVELSIVNYYETIDNSSMFSDWFLKNKKGYRDIPNQVFLFNESAFRFKINFLSPLFENLVNHQLEKNWVDVEMTYYKLLKNCLRKFNNGDKEVEANTELIRLNKDLEVLKQSLEKYLLQISNSAKVDSDFDYCANSPINIKLINERQHLNALKDIDYNDADKQFVKAKDVTFLNFNYTGLTYKMNRRNYQHINIHGSLESRRNKPIFGFGDEIDVDYLEMENTNNNEFLKHIKSFGYFNSAEYHKLINFIEADSYIIYIWGHSCGLSDRTLLSMIFEHNNCAAIKPFYWGKDSYKNNYTEMAQNISRHFKNKLKLRSRLVNKELCSPLGSDS